MNQEQDFEQIKLIRGEIDRGRVYLRSDGIFNFEVLEGLLRKHGIVDEDITDKLKPIKDELWRKLGLGEIEEDHDPYGLLASIGWEDNSTDVERPMYEHVQRWYEWMDILDSYCDRKGEHQEINIRDGWRIIYWGERRQIQIVHGKVYHTDEEDNQAEDTDFCSVLGPLEWRLEYKDYLGIGKIPRKKLSKPFFETYDGQDVEGGIISYEKAIKLCEEKFGIVPPTEEEIGRAILSHDPYLQELDKVQGEEGMFYLINRFAPKKDGGRILGPLHADEAQRRREEHGKMMEGATSVEVERFTLPTYQYENNRFERVI